jgi:hypothetical protein
MSHVIHSEANSLQGSNFVQPLNWVLTRLVDFLKIISVVQFLEKRLTLQILSDFTVAGI